jgi:hypothetical protein
MKPFRGLILFTAVTFIFLCTTSLQAKAQGFIQTQKQSQILTVSNFNVPTYTRGQALSEREIVASKEALVASYPTQSTPLFTGIGSGYSEQTTFKGDNSAMSFAAVALQIIGLVLGLPFVVIGLLNLACGKSKAAGTLIFGLCIALGGIMFGGIVNLVSG